jgi:hypothetical protein
VKLVFQVFIRLFLMALRMADKCYEEELEGILFVGLNVVVDTIFSFQLVAHRFQLLLVLNIKFLTKSRTEREDACDVVPDSGRKADK